MLSSGPDYPDCLSFEARDNTGQLLVVSRLMAETTVGDITNTVFDTYRLVMGTRVFQGAGSEDQLAKAQYEYLCQQLHEQVTGFIRERKRELREKTKEAEAIPAPQKLEPTVPGTKTFHLEP